MPVTASAPSPQPAQSDDIPGADALGDPDQLANRMGIEITEWNRDRLVATMPVAGNRQPFGLLHGGASAVLAETLGSYAAMMHVAPDRIAVGTELSCTHHRAVRGGLVTGVATPLHVGGSVATFEIVISDESGRRVCTARLTCMLRQHPPGARAEQQ